MTADKNKKIGAILLAAGGSSRLGRPKQLLTFGGKTLVRRAAEALVNSVCDPIVVVLGCETKGSLAELDGIDVTVCINDEWRSGISSSIKAGLRTLLSAEQDLDAAVITLCDQPFVTSADIDRIAERFAKAGKTIVAARHGEVVGVPALFGREIFDELFTLEGDQGARKLIRTDPKRSAVIDAEQAAIDIDTPEDLASYLI